MGEIRLAGLGKEFRGTVAVHDMTLEVREGEFLVLVGPSGCGKTTTLRMIAGLEEPTAGEIWIDGRLANDLEPGDRDVGMVFQNLALFPHKSVFENIAFGLRVAGMSREEVGRRVEAVAAILRISHLLHRMPGQLSGGEAQRVALARTLVTEPKAYLLDEPLSNLDAKLRKEMRAEIDRLHRELGKTFIYVTHDQEEAMTLADRIVVMRQGRIEQVGTPMEIYHEPANQFVASFFGSPAMNLISGMGLTLGGRPAFTFAENVWQLDGVPRLPEGPLILGVRPEAVRIGDGARFTAQVTLVEPLGKETLVYLQYEPDRFLIAIVGGEFMSDEGATVQFDFQGARLYLFDADGQRIDARARPLSPLASLR